MVWLCGRGKRLLLLLLVVHQAGTDAALLGDLYAILVAELVNLLNQLLHLLHDGLVLLLILLLGRILLLGLLIALEGPPPWITARRVIRLDAVTLPLSIIVIVLIHGFFPFCRVPTSGNPTA